MALRAGTPRLSTRGGRGVKKARGRVLLSAHVEEIELGLGLG